MGNSNFLDDIAKFGNTALSEADRMQRQVRKWAGDQVDSVVDNMDIVTKDELDVITAEYDKKIAALEAKIDSLCGAPKKAAPKKTPAKKPAAKKATAKKTS